MQLSKYNKRDIQFLCTAALCLFSFLCWIKFCWGCFRQVFFIWKTKKGGWSYLDTYIKGFGLSFWRAAMKIYAFATLFWMNKNENMQHKEIFPAHRTIYFLQLLKTSLLSETIYSQTQPAFICSNSAKIIVELSAKYIQS